MKIKLNFIYFLNLNVHLKTFSSLTVMSPRRVHECANETAAS